MSQRNRTVACVLTPHGRGAVAVVGVRGVAATEAVERYFHPANGRPLTQQPISQIIYGHWRAGETETAGGEDLVVCRLSATQLEIHCHGGAAASAQVIGGLVDAGCEEVTGFDWLQLEYECPLRAAAHHALSKASTERTASILLDQYHGALRREVEAIVAEFKAGRADAADRRLSQLLQFAEFGRHLTQPWQVVLAGRPNVGKSSLINALVGYERSIVFDQPGTTRDLVTARTAIDGWPIELSDTAGLHAAEDAIEAAGIELASQRLAQANLCLWVLDTSWLPVVGPNECWSLVQQQADEVGLQCDLDRTLIVLNKIDLATTPTPDGPSLIATSATSGAGMRSLLDAIVEQLVPASPAGGAAVPFTDSQIELLTMPAQWAVPQKLARIQQLLC